MTTIFQGWKMFERRLPHGIDPGGKEVLRRAFYHGAAAMFQLMVDVGGSDNAADAQKRFTALDAELDAFGTDMRHG